MNKNKITCVVLAVCITVPTALEPLNVLASEIKDINIQSGIYENKEYTTTLKNDNGNLLNVEDVNSNNADVPSENKENEEVKDPIKNPLSEENQNLDETKPENKEENLNNESNVENTTEETAPPKKSEGINNTKGASRLLPTVVNIPDAKLKAAINSALTQSPNADITDEQLAGVRHISGYNKGITNLEGLQYCTSLLSLDLRHNQISDISKIANLTTLNNVYLSGNRITEVSSLLNLTNLTYLDIAYNSISDISQLEVLTKLQGIDFTGNTISNISVLDKFPALTRLSFGNSSITDISVIDRIPNLIELFMYNCNISSIEVIRKHTNLIRLAVAGSKVSDISVINVLNKLDYLGLNQNLITDISPILNKTTLTTLELSGNQITDISPISSLINLTYLGVGNNKISNLTPLKDLTTLNHLMIDNNKITDISHISGLTNLVRLGLSANTISDISPLSNMTKLSSLGLFNNKITDISHIRNLTNLTDLNFSDNSVEDISHLAAMTKLNYLYFRGNKVSNIEVLANMPSLAYLDISGNRISDIRVVSRLTNLYYFWAYNQTIENTQSIYSSGNVAVVGNSLLDREGNTIAPINIEGSGVYDVSKNQITWNNITKDSTLAYQFNNEIQIGSDKYYFSGTVKNNIKYNQLPTINAEDKIVFKGGTFDPLNGVTAADPEDGDITANIKVIENTVDTGNVGSYRVVYEITDSRGSKTTKTINVAVKIKMSGMNSIPSIEASNKEIYSGEIFEPLKDVIAKDKEDGDITSKIVITENTVNTSIPGDYRVMYEVYDSQGAKCKKLISVKVKKNNAPTITANNLEIVEGDAFDPLKGVIAIDHEDGDITNKISIIENTVNNNVPGIYKVVYEVSDRLSVKTTKEIEVKVKIREIVINIPDKEVQDSLNQLLGQEIGSELTDVKLKEIKELDLSGKKVDSLKGLEYCINLEKLYLPKSSISDVSSLKDLKHLKELDLSNNKINDISHINNITTLEKLNISENLINKIDGIENLTSLKTLNIEGNSIDNITSLEKMKSLIELSLGGEKITDRSVTNVNKLSNLKVLNIKDSNITNTNSINNLKNLEELTLENNKIEDVSSLKDLKNLNNLNLERNKISNVEDLATLTSLNSLNLNENKITDISSLSKLSGYSYITAQNQYIDGFVEIYSVGEVAEATNKIVGINGEAIKATNIEGNGTYNEDLEKIEWKNIKSDKKYKYEFTNMKKDTRESRGYAMARAGGEVPFSGTVVQNIRFNNLPLINAKDKVVKLNEEFDPLKDVIARDAEDGDITKNIKVTENTVDTSKIGSYKVSYEVLDSKGAKGIKTIKVDVKEELPKTGLLGSVSLLGGLIVGAGATLIGKRRKNK